MDPFIGQIIMFGGNFAPRGWALCNGQLQAIAQNPALFSIIGTTYGGDGRTTFALPDLRGRAPISAGQGPGLSNYRLGDRRGAESHVLNVNTLPAHSHTAVINTSAQPADDAEGGGRHLAVPAVDIYSVTPGDQPLAGASITTTGGGQAVDHMPPVLAVNYIIALMGVFPARN
ncbi:MAG: microcystin-dependent protein [Bradymonadia bacterium]